jgi:hypothetical protein
MRFKAIIDHAVVSLRHSTRSAGRGNPRGMRAAYLNQPTGENNINEMVFMRQLR